VAVTAISAETVIRVFFIFISSVVNADASVVHSGYERTSMGTVGLHLNFRGDVAEFSTWYPHAFRGESLTSGRREAGSGKREAERGKRVNRVWAIVSLVRLSLTEKRLISPKFARCPRQAAARWCPIFRR
jgi:hypothetical protein